MNKILIVDDNELSITILLEALGREYDVRVATNDVEVFEFLEEEIPDLIVLDIVLGEVNGIEICKKIKRNFRTRFIPIIFLTATYDLMRTEAYDAGADDFMVKPFRAKVLHKKIEALLQDI